MEIDKKTIKVLAADTRLKILKSLGNRRKMPSELSRELDLAPSTIIEHLNKLEKVDLIKREETGHKWVYYNLTRKGIKLIRPKYPTQFFIILSLGLIFIASGFVKYLYQPMELAATELEKPARTVAAGEATKTVGTEFVQPTDWLMVGLFAIGIILIVISLIIKLKKKSI